jgi:hypothetical protein
LARVAIQTAHEKRWYGGVFLGFSELDTVMNGIARILWFQRSRLTETQLRIAELLRKGRSQSDAAEELNITRQAISKQVVSMGWGPYAEAEEAWRVILERYINPVIDKKNVSHQR